MRRLGELNMTSSQRSRQPLSTCYFCSNYIHTGRRGGHCKLLNVEVHSNWSACSLAIPPFAPSWETSRTPALLELISQDLETAV
jgi:hypothetical protein